MKGFKAFGLRGGRGGVLVKYNGEKFGNVTGTLCAD